MKTIFFSALLSMAAWQVLGQECNGYFAFQKGMKIEMISYDKKDKVAATLKYEVIDKKAVDGGTAVVFKNETFDNKGRILASSEVNGKCVNDNFYTDVRNIGSDMMPKSPDMEMTVTGEQMIYPHALKAGQKLPDASINIKSGLKGGMPLMNMTVNITDRQVEKFETLETPAGKFECAKITYNTNFKLMGNRTYKNVEYMAKGVGLVKSEQYDDKGNRQSYMLLSKVEK